jgi:hypothetical protein
MARQQVPGDGKAKWLKIATVGDFERFGRVGDGEISRLADLFVITLRVAAYSFELKINPNFSRPCCGRCTNGAVKLGAWSQ